MGRIRIINDSARRPLSRCSARMDGCGRTVHSRAVQCRVGFGVITDSPSDRAGLSWFFFFFTFLLLAASSAQPRLSLSLSYCATAACVCIDFFAVVG